MTTHAVSGDNSLALDKVAIERLAPGAATGAEKADPLAADAVASTSPDSDDKDVDPVPGFEDVDDLEAVDDSLSTEINTVLCPRTTARTCATCPALSSSTAHIRLLFNRTSVA